jgi:hypothetical protein
MGNKLIHAIWFQAVQVELPEQKAGTGEMLW